MPLTSWNDLLNNAKDETTDRTPVPPGEYDFVVKDAKFARTSTDKDMYKVTCEVQGGAHNGRYVWVNFVKSPESRKAMSIFFSQFNVLGLGAQFFQSEPNNDQIVEKLKGARFLGTVAIEQYQGKEKNEIKKIAAPRAGGPTTAAAGPPQPSPAAPPKSAAAPPQPAAPAPAAPAPTASETPAAPRPANPPAPATAAPAVPAPPAPPF